MTKNEVDKKCCHLEGNFIFYATNWLKATKRIIGMCTCKRMRVGNEKLIKNPQRWYFRISTCKKFNLFAIRLENDFLSLSFKSFEAIFFYIRMKGAKNIYNWNAKCKTSITINPHTDKHNDGMKKINGNLHFKMKSFWRIKFVFYSKHFDFS